MTWLKEHLETSATAKEIAEILTMIGLELENIDNPGERLKDFVVAHVERVEKHPNADRLKLCQVNNGKETVEVICGAPNAREGMKGVFACVGLYIPALEITLKQSKIRGVVSNGMLLSEKEMGLSEDHEGIVELPDDAVPGAPVPVVMGLDDPVFEISITPNRGDCLGVRGIARDLAAAGIGKLKPFMAKPMSGTFKSPISVHLDFDEKTRSACPYFVGRYFRGVNNGDSPRWLKDQLLKIGLRPISALVDITNYFTVAYGRPLHVFDADKVKGNIHVRLSRSGEKFLALDGKEYTLDDGMTLIADEKSPEALGGVMGGQHSGCTENTKNVFLEAAYFDPARTAITGRKLNLQSDARFRFERGIDPEFQLPATELASKFITDFCGGEVSEMLVVGENPNVPRSYFLRKNRIKELGGVTIPTKHIRNILGALGFELSEGSDGWDCLVPSWRHDVVGEADLVEEVLRIHGFDEIPAVPLKPDIALPTGVVNRHQERRAFARRGLAARGMTEAITFSFIPNYHAALFGGVKDSLHLVNPISTELDVMRPAILPNLIDAVRRNGDRGIEDSALFEVGPQFKGENPEDQITVVAGVRSGNWASRSWSENTRKVDLFDAKADVIDVLLLLGLQVFGENLEATAPNWYHPGRSGSFKLGPKMTLAHFGEIHPGVLKGLNVEDRMVAFEIFLDSIPLSYTKKGSMRTALELSPYQLVERDFAFVVDIEVTAQSLINIVRTSEKNIIKDVQIFDLFGDAILGENKKSIGITVVLQPLTETLTDAEIDNISEKIVANVNKKTGGVLRA